MSGISFTQSIIEGAESATTDRLSAAIDQPHTAPAGVLATAKQNGLHSAVFKSLLIRFGPIAARAALGYVAEKYGAQIQSFISEYDEKIGVIVGAEKWGEIKSVLAVFTPGAIDRAS